MQTWKKLLNIDSEYQLTDAKKEELKDLAKEERSLTALMSQLSSKDAAQLKQQIDRLRTEVPQDTNNPDDVLLCQWTSYKGCPFIPGKETKGLLPFTLTRKEIPHYQEKNYLKVLCTYEVVKDNSKKEEPAGKKGPGRPAKTEDSAGSSE